MASRRLWGASRALLLRRMRLPVYSRRTDPPALGRVTGRARQHLL